MLPDTVRLMKLEKDMSGDADMKRLLSLSASTTADAKPQPAKRDVQALSQEEWRIPDLERKLEGTGPTPAEQETQQLRELFDEMSSDGSSVDKEGVASIRKEMGADRPLPEADMEAAMAEMSAVDGKVSFDQLVEWWRRTMSSQPTLDEILLADAQRYQSKLGDDPALSAPLAQRFTQPRVQSELATHLLPRRKPLIPRMARRSKYSDRFVVKPADSGDSSGAKSMKDETERKFDLLELGLDHVPQFYVAELPDAEEIATRPTPLQLTITNPLDVACTLRFCDGAVGARLASEFPDDTDAPVDTTPGKHRAVGDVDAGVNAEITMVDGNEFAELTMAAKPMGEMGGTSPDPDLPGGDTSEGEPSCVVIRNGNRVRRAKRLLARRSADERLILKSMVSCATGNNSMPGQKPSKGCHEDEGT